MTENNSSSESKEEQSVNGDVFTPEETLPAVATVGAELSSTVIDFEDNLSLDSASVFSATTTTTRSKSKSPNTRKLRRLCRRVKAPKMVQPLYKYRWGISG